MNNGHRGRGYLRNPNRDLRDRPFGASRQAGVVRATEASMEHLIHGIRNQGGTSSCVGHSTRGAIELRRVLDGHKHVPLSALGLYWAARAKDSFELEDGGAYIRSAMYVAHRLGIPSEKAWPFSESRVNDRPDSDDEIEALTRSDGVYERITGTDKVARVEAVLDALQASCPVVCDVNADYLLDTKETVSAPRPQLASATNHAVYLCGFDRSGGRFRMVNSWSSPWADGGKCWLASEWLMYSSDVWALRPAQVQHA